MADAPACRWAGLPGWARAGIAGAVLSGIPSTAVARRRGDDVWESSRAAGTLLGRPTLPRAAVAHVGVSLFWAAVLARVLPRRHTVAWGAAAGLGIAAVDLGVVARRYPRIRALPAAPQWLDHVAYGVVVGAVLSRVRGSRARPSAPRRGRGCR